MEPEVHRKAKILIIDDEPDTVTVLENILRVAGGYSNLHSSTDAREAEALYSQFLPDLIMLDLRMPELDGFQVLEQLRALIPPEVYLPIVVLTADASNETRSKSLTSGATDFLTKPIDTQQVLLRLRNLLKPRFLYLQLQEQNRFLDEQVLARTSELTAANEALHQSEMKFRSVVESATDAIILMDNEARIVAWNKSAQTIFGYEAPEVLGHPVTMLMPERFRAIPDSEGLAYQETQGTLVIGRTIERRGLRRDGIEFPIEVAFSTWEAGGERFYSGIIRDITERTRTERELRNSEMLLAEAQRLSRIGSWDWNVITGTLDWTDELYRIYGMSSRQQRVSYEDSIERVHPADRELFKAIIATALREHQPFDLYHRIVRPDGTVRIVHGRGAVVIDDEGNPMRMFGSTQDVTELKQAETALEQSLDQLEAVLNAVPCGVSWISSDLRYLGVNSYLARILDLDREDVIGLAVGFRDGKSDFTEFASRFFASSERAAEAEIEVDTDGAVRKLLMKGRKYGHGQAAVLIGTDITEIREAEALLRRAHDDLEIRVRERTAELAEVIEALRGEIAERKRAEAQLSEQREILQNIFDHIPVMISLYDVAGKLKLVNREWERVSGWSFDEASIHPEIMAEFFPDPGNRLCAEEFIQRAQNGWSDSKVKVRDGRVLDTTWTSIRLADGTRIGIGKDVTARKQAEFELQESETKFRTIFETALDAILLANNTGAFVDANPAACVLLGVQREHLLGQSFTDFGPSDGQSALSAKWEEFLREGHQRGECELLRTDGSLRQAEYVAMAGLLGGFHLLVMRDITQRKENEVLLQEGKETADRANRAKSEFLSRMSHELRTPLNAIIGFSQLFEPDKLDSDECENLEQILKAGRHLLALINEVLDLSRIEAGRMSLSIEPVCVREVAQEVLGLLQPLANQRHIRLDNIIGTEDCHVLADRQRLKQVLLNFVSNAIKYNRDSGRVTISCEPVMEDRRRLMVIDTGPGIATSNLHKLFEPFERLGAEQSGTEGTGIGLALSKRLIEIMGGRIGVDSVSGQGSTFWAEMPLANSPIGAREDSGDTGIGVQPGEDSGRARTVLYVEDNLSNLKLIEHLLTHRPWVRLVAAMQGSLGIDLARENQPDLILLDLHLPDMRGDEVLLRLQADPATREIPVVMLSADAAPKQVQRLLSLGAREYFTKPLDVRKFLVKMDEILGAKENTI